jgi:hypothetical protein
MGFLSAFAPLLGGLLGGGKSGSSEDSRYTDALSKILSFLPQGQINNPVLDKATGYYDQVMSDGYSAISPAERQRMYNQRAGEIQDNIIKGQEDNLGSRLARSGMAGSRVGAKLWQNQTNANNKLLSGVYNDIEDQNLQYTMQNKAQAFASAPTLANLFNNQQTAHLNPWLQYASLLKGNSQKSNSNDGLFGALGNFLAAGDAANWWKKAG